jgi:hypothetical protein
MNPAGYENEDPRARLRAAPVEGEGDRGIVVEALAIETLLAPEGLVVHEMDLAELARRYPLDELGTVDR